MSESAYSRDDVGARTPLDGNYGGQQSADCKGKTIAGKPPVDNLHHARLNASAMLPFDASTTIAKMMLDVAHLARGKGEPYRRERHIGPALELMYVMMTVLVATRDGKPIHASEIARRLDMPRTNVRRHLGTLVASGRLSVIGQSYAPTDYVNKDPAMQAVLRETVQIIVKAAQNLSGFL
jgi:IclR helix-turn-helix domain